jgi:DNA-binding transcriptional regulator YiaG
MVCHRCDVRACVNPAHLFVGTAAENMRDMGEKGRRATRQKHGRAKLTSADVNAIREALGTTSHASIARTFGVSRGRVSDIASGKTWKL